MSYPERISNGLASIVGNIESEKIHRGKVPAISSLYGLILDAGFCLCKSYRGLLIKPANFLSGREYMPDVRMKLHSFLGEVTESDDDPRFAAELVSLNINTAQHFLHILLDRILNVLILHNFRDKESQLALVFYHPESLRISLLRWRIEKNEDLKRELKELDRSFTKWEENYHPGSCNEFVRKIIFDNIAAGGLDRLNSIEKTAINILETISGDVHGSIRFIVDRTNEAKHLPDGTGRAQLVLDLENAEGVRRLYEVEWVLTFLAFESLINFINPVLKHLGTAAEHNA
jgi:hypothetical protein